MTSPIVIAHRGASGYLPEHTLAAYFVAIEQGADYIEPDLVMTKDGVLVARHENEISGTTDVAQHPRFASRKTTKTIDGEKLNGWFTEDFTLSELKQLRAMERIPQLRPGNTRFDRMFEIPAWEEILSLAHDLKVRGSLGGKVGVYPETKHPSYFQSVGLPMEAKLVETLHRFGYAGREGRAFIQSFETANLKALRKLTELPLVQLIDDQGKPWDCVLRGEDTTYAQMTKPGGLRQIATYANAIGANKNLVIPRAPNRQLGEATPLAANAHAAGLKVHAWTFRAENHFLPDNLRSGGEASQQGRLQDEIAAFLATGLDGVFSDHPDFALRARRAAHGRQD
ncbi:MAG: glycerophosphodiester phosphodiesterase [Betaproteobacteria bacterium]|nr:glycerophosphodiester phosphodiesterase [Betaproteobacteria bacterium]